MRAIVSDQITATSSRRRVSRVENFFRLQKTYSLFSHDVRESVTRSLKTRILLFLQSWAFCVFPKMVAQNVIGSVKVIVNHELEPII